MATLNQWFEGSRPRTLPAAIAPVAVGTGLAVNAGAASAPRAALALVVALALQVGVNYSNDYSDGIRGTDTDRVGPVRLVGQQLAAAGRVRMAAFAFFGLACVAGLALVAVSGYWWLLLVGACCVAAAWLYTGGPHPYGYAGLGEVFVLIFFGIVPVLGTCYVQSGTVSPAALIASVSVGLLACAVLVTNNLRDIPTDEVSGKRTLAVRLGDARTRRLYAACIAVSMVCTVAIAWLLGLIILAALLVFILAPVRVVMSNARGRALVPALKQTGLLVLLYGLALGGLLVVLRPS